MKENQYNMKNILLILLAVLPFICFGQSQDYKLAQLQIKRESLMSDLTSIKNQIAEIDKEIDLLKNTGNVTVENEKIATSVVTKDATLRTNPIAGENVLTKIEKGEKVDVLSIEEDYYKLSYKNSENIGNRTVENKVIATSVITMDATLRTNPVAGDKVITIIKKGEKVDVLSIEKDYYKISYENSVGYVSDLYLNDPALRQIAEKQKREAIELERNTRYQDLVKIFGTISANRILNHETWIGMTSYEAMASIGLPKNVNKTEGTFGIHEQWVYGEIPYTKYLYFENGKLTIIQD